jgi:predicted metal-dependent enzyme (double-stranded beta helix superfamily)
VQSATTSGAGVPAAAAEPIREHAGATDLDHLPGRPLSQPELLALAASVAATPELWSEHLAFDDEHRHYVCVHRDENVDVWLICWTPTNDTGWHDHDVSSGSVAVVRGRLSEHNLMLGGPSIETTIGEGRVFSFGPEHIHRLTGVDPRSVSVHAYSPPLDRMGQYDAGPDGVLRRTTVTYEEELRSPESIVTEVTR